MENFSESRRTIQRCNRSTAPRPGAIRNYILFTIVLPTLTALLITVGLGTVFVLYVIVHCVQRENGVLFVNEDGRQHGLTVSSLTSSLITVANPLVMTLLAYIAALRWLAAQTRSGTFVIEYSGELPTPLQFGLMLRLLGAEGIFSLWDSAKYLNRKKSRRATAPHFFKAVFAIALLSYILRYAVAGADYYLHHTTSTTSLNVPLPPQPRNYSIKLNGNLCTNSSSNQKCLSSSIWAENNAVIAKTGLQVVSDNSASLSLTTFNASRYTSVLKPRDIDKWVEFRAITYGARADCKSINRSCIRAGGETKRCANIGISEVPIDRRASTLWDPITSFIIGRIGNTSVGPFDLYSDAQGMVPSVPATILLHLQWPNHFLPPFYPPSKAVDAEPHPFIHIFARCDLSFLTATLKRSLDQDQERYVLEEEDLLDPHMVDILLPPLLYQYATDIFASNLHATAVSETNVTSVEAHLSKELSRIAIGLTAGLFQLAPTNNHTLFERQVVVRYCFVSVFLFVALLYAYAFLVLSIVIWGLVDFYRGNRRLFQDIAIAQLKLSNPLVVVATMFPSKDIPVAPETCAMELFDEGQALENALRLYISGNRLYGLQDWDGSGLLDARSSAG